MHFLNNSAGGKGNSVYFTTIDSCLYLCTRNISARKSVKNIFQCIGKVEYDKAKRGEFVTYNHDFSITKNKHITDDNVVVAVPGKAFELSVKVIDQLDNSLDAVFTAKVEAPYENHLSLIQRTSVSRTRS